MHVLKDINRTRYSRQSKHQLAVNIDPTLHMVISITFFKMTRAVTLCLIVTFSCVSLTYSQGSTKHLKEIVLGRCWDFQRQKVHEGSEKNCSKIWETFYKAFANKDPCNSTFADYKPYFDEVGMDIIKPNKVKILIAGWAAEL